MTVRNDALAGLVILVWLFGSTQSLAQCPEEPELQNWTGSGSVSCPCFAIGERAGSVLDLPGTTCFLYAFLGHLLRLVEGRTIRAHRDLDAETPAS